MPPEEYQIQVASDIASLRLNATATNPAQIGRNCLLRSQLRPKSTKAPTGMPAGALAGLVEVAGI